LKGIAMKIPRVRLSARWSVLFMLVVSSLSGCRTPVDESQAIDLSWPTQDCTQEKLAGIGPLDVAIAIDTSLSTQRPSGSDIDGDGLVGEIADNQNTDRGDTILSAQVAAVRRLLAVADRADIRFSIVTFSGPSSAAPLLKRGRVVTDQQAEIRIELTADKEALGTILDKMIERGGLGTTDFYAAMRRANRSLTEGEDPEQARRKLVLLVSDSAGPTHRDIDGRIDDRNPNMELAAREALRHGIVFNTFGLSAESGYWRFFPLGRIAGATGGSYHVVEDPLALYCYMAGSLVKPDPLR